MVPARGTTDWPNLAAHFGYVISGRMGVRSRGGIEAQAGPSEAFAAMEGHDAWVVGDEPCIALDWRPIED